MDEIEQELVSENEELRRLAVVALARLPLRESRELIFRAMADESWRVRKEAVTVLLAAGRPDAELIQGLIALLRSHDNAGLRNSAVESLERLGPIVVEPLLPYLTDEDDDLRKFVIDILGSIGVPSCVPYLVTAMDDPDDNVRSAAVENLGKVGDPRAVPHLLQALAKGDVWFRYTVLDALTRIGAPVPLGAIAPLLGEGLLKRAVYDCLGAVGNAEAVPLLVDGLKDRARNVRESAVQALMKLRGRLDDGERSALDRSLAALKGDPALEGLLTSLEQADGETLQQLVCLLGIIGDRRGVLGLLAVSRRDRVRGGCVQAFRNMGSEILPELLAYFPHAEPEERTFIAYLLGELRVPGGEKLLIEGLRDDACCHRIACVVSLGKLAVPGACRQIAPLLGDREQEVRSAALEALTHLAVCDPSQLSEICAELAVSKLPERRRDAAQLLLGLDDAEKLFLLAKDEDASVRKAAVVSISRARLPQAVGHLVMALVDEEPEVRIAAAAALGELGGDQALEPLLLALRDRDPWVQTAALKGLAALGNRAALPGVTEHLKGAQGSVLIAGLKTLAALGDGGVLEPVRAALDNEDEEVVEAAIDILSRYDRGWIEECKEKLLRHPHWAVRRSFVRVLGAALGERALPYLERALEQETDPLVQREIEDLMGRRG